MKKMHQISEFTVIKVIHQLWLDGFLTSTQIENILKHYELELTQLTTDVLEAKHMKEKSTFKIDLNGK